MSLHQPLFLNHHVVTQIIKPELIVGSVGNICSIRFSSGVRVGLKTIYTINSESVKVKNGLIPLRIPLGKIGVYCNDMDTPAGECIQVGGEKCRQGFTLTRLHLCNAALIHGDRSS